MSHRKSKESSRPSSDAGSDVHGESSVAQHERVDVDDLIRMRAYELYLERADEPSDNLGDWLQAEREYRERSHDQAEL